jgi:tripartite-type tricarboxylate transporter receptor subunit TctC
MKRILIPMLVLAAAGVLAASGAQAASADAAYPNKPIRMVVPFTSGSATDIIARIIGPKLTDSHGQQVVVDNRPSAGGIVAFKIVADATPDGHTLTATGSNFSGSAALYAGKLPYDAVKDFAGIGQIATTPLVLVVGSGLGVKSAKDLISLAKQKPGQLNFASTGLGSGTHYGAALFNLAAALDVVHVPFRGTPEALTDTIAGRIHYFLSPVLASAPLIRSGRVLALGVTTTTRAPGLPDVPTLAEAALPGFVYEGWYGVLAPAKTPRRIIKLLSSELQRILGLDEVKEKIASRGAAAKWTSSEVFDKLVRDEIATRTKVWKAAGVKAD